MKSKKTTACITAPKNKKLWQLYQNLGKFAESTNHLPDAQEVKNNKPKSAPLELLPMVF